MIVPGEPSPFTVGTISHAEVDGISPHVGTSTMLLSEANAALMGGSWTDSINPLDPYFDYSTFARPWNYDLNQAADTTDWFSSQFFAALRETDPAYSPPYQTWHTTDYDLAGMEISGNLDQDRSLFPSSVQHESELQRHTRTDTQLPELTSGHGSRVASPPNESSHEDQLPFAWNPRSKQIARAKPIVLPVDDHIFTRTDPTVAISEAALSRISTFLRSSKSLDGEDTFTLPDLSLVNVFISLFFTKFLPQTPVLHRPTIEVEALPSALLAIIMMIGSCYSRLRHTRRFGIIVLDRIRQNLLALIEEDNSLMREPMTIYAAALVCYVGLWCGNKRAFELAEAFRAVVVTYIRRLPNAHHHEAQILHQGHRSFSREHHIGTRDSGTFQSQWTNWATQESNKRLRWFVYMIDSQFPAILGMNGMMTIADIRRWECPCDQEFWTMTSASSWKNRLGSASEPPCPVFGSLTALLLSASEPPNTGVDDALLPNVNAWSANLLMIAVMSEIFQYQEALVVLQTYEEPTSQHCTGFDLSAHQSYRAKHLLAMLELWHHSHVVHFRLRRPDATSTHLQRCSMIMYRLARLYLVFPVSAIQDCLGRSGPTDARAAMARLAAQAKRDLPGVILAVEDAASCISLIMCNKGESDPYDLIGLFLCHVVLWSFAHAASSDQKISIIQHLQAAQDVSPGMLDVIQAGFAGVGAQSGCAMDAPQFIFKHAIQSLVQLGTWGASSNLALLLHLHPGIVE